MAIGNVSIQISGGGNTLGIIQTSGNGVFFPNVLYRYANLTLPYSPNDPGLTYTYNNSTLAPVVLLYARFFNLLNEPSAATVANVGTTAFTTSGAVGVSGAQNCLDVRTFGAVGDGVADDTAAIQAALNQAYQNYLGNLIASKTTNAQNSQVAQSIIGNVGNGSSQTLSLILPVAPTLGNTIILTFSVMNYGNGPGSPAIPTVTDNRGNTYASVTPAQDGEFLLYTYYATVGTASSTTITIAMTGRNFNSFISAIASEFLGLYTPLTVDGQFSAAGISSFPTILLPATNQGDLVIYSVGNLAAQGVQPIPPQDFTLVNSIICPQPNGLNGAVPCTSMAYQNWSGIVPISSQWTIPNGAFGGCAVLAAFRRIPLAATPPGKTVVCIPQGVSCMVSPQPNFDHPDPAPYYVNRGWNSHYGPMAYSLVMSDGVTLEIDGSLISNPNANSLSISGTQNLGGEFGWALITNTAWILNRTLTTALTSSITWAGYLAGTLFNEGPRNTGIKVTGIGKVYMNGPTQAALPTDVFDGITPCGFPNMTLARFYCADNSTISGLEIVSPWGTAVQWGHSVGATIDSLYIHDDPNIPSAEIGGYGDTGEIEMDMLRNSRVTNNKIVTCPQCSGVLDFAGYQNVISGNTMNGCYEGYQYQSAGGEFSWSFTTEGQNSEISQNTAINCLDWGFDFLPGGTLVTGTGFHDNIASGNISGDFTASSKMAFRSNVNNSFTSGGTPVANGVNTVTGETPTGAINGTNVNFTLAHIPVAGSVIGFLNGLQQVSGTDFTVSGKVVTLAVAPNSGSTLTFNYQYLSGN